MNEMVAATHAVVKDERNETIYIGMRDGVTGEFNLVPRDGARVSVFDSAFMLGDGIWEVIDTSCLGILLILGYQSETGGCAICQRPPE